MALFCVGKCERKAIEENAPYWRGLSASTEKTGRITRPNDPERISRKHAAILVTCATARKATAQFGADRQGTALRVPRGHDWRCRPLR